MAIDAFKKKQTNIRDGLGALSIPNTETTMQRLGQASLVKPNNNRIDEIIKTGEAKKMMQDAMSEVEVVFLLDESGSIIEQDMRNKIEGKPSIIDGTKLGFNKLIAEQKKASGRTIVSTVLFNSSSRFIHDRVPVQEIKGFNFAPIGGGTALNDTLAHQIKYIKERRALENHPHENVLFVIETDGEDLCSSTDDETLKSIISERIRAGWKFMFLLEENILNIENFANLIGISTDDVVNYSTEGRLGVVANFLGINNAINELRQKSAISPNWKKPIIENKIEADNARLLPDYRKTR